MRQVILIEFVKEINIDQIDFELVQIYEFQNRVVLIVEIVVWYNKCQYNVIQTIIIK